MSQYDLTLSDSLVNENVLAVMYFLTFEMPILHDFADKDN